MAETSTNPLVSMLSGGTRRAQHPLIKESTLNHHIKAPYNLKYIPYLMGYRALWGVVSKGH